MPSDAATGKPRAAAAAPEPVLLVMADISGYTRYMTANAKTLAHSQTIITELVQALVRHAELPLEVAKLEGDAVFFFARRPAAVAAPELGRRLLGFFETFRATLHELAAAGTCTCGACARIETLRLKLIVHAGEALFHDIAGFRELAGPDVIIVHRLLKNSVPAHEYLLVSEAARQFVALPPELPWSPTVERYADLGAVAALVFLRGAAETPAAAAAPSSGRVLRWHLKLWQGVFAGPARPGREFAHLEPRSGIVGRTALAGVALALSPLLLPVNLIQAVIRRGRGGGDSARDGAMRATEGHAP